MAPKTAVPKQPPIPRKNVALEVATPRSWYDTEFWTATTNTCMISPSPTPKTNM